jgi:DNA-binding NarL/FixJ family response regulator
VAAGEQRLDLGAQQVAADLFVSETTVETHVARIFAKLGAPGPGAGGGHGLRVRTRATGRLIASHVPA